MVFFENIAEPSKESPREGDESPDGEFHQCLIKGIDCFLGLLLASHCCLYLWKLVHYGFIKAGPGRHPSQAPFDVWEAIPVFGESFSLLAPGRLLSCSFQSRPHSHVSGRWLASAPCCPEPRAWETVSVKDLSWCLGQGPFGETEVAGDEMASASGLSR